MQGQIQQRRPEGVTMLRCYERRRTLPSRSHSTPSTADHGGTGSTLWWPRRSQTNVACLARTSRVGAP